MKMSIRLQPEASRFKVTLSKPLDEVLGPPVLNPRTSDVLADQILDAVRRESEAVANLVETDVRRLTRRHS